MRRVLFITIIRSVGSLSRSIGHYASPRRSVALVSDALRNAGDPPAIPPSSAPLRANQGLSRAMCALIPASRLRQNRHRVAPVPSRYPDDPRLALSETDGAHLPQPPPEVGAGRHPACGLPNSGPALGAARACKGHQSARGSDSWGLCGSPRSAPPFPWIRAPSQSLQVATGLLEHHADTRALDHPVAICPSDRGVMTSTREGGTYRDSQGLHRSSSARASDRVSLSWSYGRPRSSPTWVELRACTAWPAVAGLFCTCQTDRLR